MLPNLINLPVSGCQIIRQANVGWWQYFSKRPWGIFWGFGKGGYYVMMLARISIEICTRGLGFLYFFIVGELGLGLVGKGGDRCLWKGVVFFRTYVIVSGI
jgi:hypothetical protein